jgi:hypothetical protein
MKEFQINKYLKLQFNEGKTNIYINDQLFRKCKFLLINIKSNNVSRFEDIKSIDEAELILDATLEEERLEGYEIKPEEEFWAHCSNLQAWAKHRYDTRLLHRTLAFPILKELTDLGDPEAKVVFKEEIISRFENGYPSVVRYLIREGFIRNYVKEELIETLLDAEEVANLRNLEILSKTKMEIVEEIDMFYGGSQYAVEFNKNKLIGLELRHLNIEQFPYEITELASLQKLLLERNILREVPKEIGDLQNLRELNFSENQLESLPEEIGSIKSLESLFLNGNKFKIFPEVVTRLKNLKYLSLSKNHISKIPESISNLENLKILALNNNRISKLPESIGNLKSLELLFLGNNRLASLPRSIEKLTSLKELELRSNKLVSFPESLFRLHNLKKLDVSENDIYQIPNLLKLLNYLDIFEYDKKKIK